MTFATNSFPRQRKPIDSKSRRAAAPERLDRLHDAAQFRQALQAADERVAGVDALLAVVAEQMAVVGAHRDFSVDAPFRAPAPLFGHQRRDEADHVGFAGEMVGLEE